ncbi:hypothetical protein HOE67_05280 [Candidatus Peregrinibacteria bacterium]|jgi:hypothetical protein|nr:hypothetical protein [Candidatus Peregrinibacteria bacterium]MBT4056495.1 hypothetical protein [Candidatus Peregrinibacteria bacterium]
MASPDHLPQPVEKPKKPRAPRSYGRCELKADKASEKSKAYFGRKRLIEECFSGDLYERIRGGGKLSEFDKKFLKDSNDFHDHKYLFENSKHQEDIDFLADAFVELLFDLKRSRMRYISYDEFLLVRKRVSAEKMQEYRQKYDLTQMRVDSEPEGAEMRGLEIGPGQMHRLLLEDQLLFLKKNRWNHDYIAGCRDYLPVHDLGFYGVSVMWLPKLVSKGRSKNFEKIFGFLLNRRQALKVFPELRVKNLKSLAISIEHMIESSGGALTYSKEVFEKLFGLVLEEHLRLRDFPVIDGNTKFIVLTARGGNSYIGDGSSSFPNEEVVDTIVELGGDKKKIAKPLKPKNNTLKESRKIKKRFLNSIRKSRGKTTIVYNGHGLPDGLSISCEHKEEGGVYAPLRNATQDAARIISPKEIALALKESNNIENIFFLVNTCFFYNIADSINRELAVLGVKERPMYWGASNKDRRSFTIGDTTFFFEALKKAAFGDGKLFLGRFFEAEMYKNSQDNFLRGPRVDTEMKIDGLEFGYNMEGRHGV